MKDPLLFTDVQIKKGRIVEPLTRNYLVKNNPIVVYMINNPHDVLLYVCLPYQTKASNLPNYSTIKYVSVPQASQHIAHDISH